MNIRNFANRALSKFKSVSLETVEPKRPAQPGKPANPITPNNPKPTIDNKFNNDKFLFGFSEDIAQAGGNGEETDSAESESISGNTDTAQAGGNSEETDSPQW